MLRPLKDKILIKSLKAEERTSGGLIVPDMAKEKPVTGEIVAVGTGVVTPEGNIIPLEVKVGDKVLFEKWSGTEIKIDDQDLVIVKEIDIIGVF